MKSHPEGDTPMTDGTLPIPPLALTPIVDETDKPIGWYRLLEDGESSLFDQPSIPDFDLSGVSDLLSEALSRAEADGGQTMRLLFSAEGEDALAKGVAELVRRSDGSPTGMLRDVSSGRFREMGRLVGVGTPLAATPEAMVALVTVQALTQLAGHLQQAFASIEERLQRIEAKIDKEYRDKVIEQVEGAKADLQTAKDGEIWLRHSGDIPPIVNLGSAVSSSASRWGAARARFDKLRGQLEVLTESPKRAKEYERIARQALPHGVYQMRAEVVMLASAGLARLHCLAASKTYTQVHDNAPPTIIRHLEDSQREVVEFARGARMFLTELGAARILDDSLAIKDRIPTVPSGRLPEAVNLHFDFTRAAHLASTVLELDADQTGLMELEIRRQGGKVVARARASRERTEDLRITDVTGGGKTFA